MNRPAELAQDWPSLVVPALHQEISIDLAAFSLAADSRNQIVATPRTATAVEAAGLFTRD